MGWKTTAGAILLEITLGLMILLLVVLLVASVFPTSYQGSLQAARLSEGVAIARRVLERQKSTFPATPIASQTLDLALVIQDRSVMTRYLYEVQMDSPPMSYPQLWKVTVRWQHRGREQQISLVGASPVP